MDRRAGTRPTGKRLESEPAATGLAQDPGAVAEQGAFSVGFQRRDTQHQNLWWWWIQRRGLGKRKEALVEQELVSFRLHGQYDQI